MRPPARLRGLTFLLATLGTIPAVDAQEVPVQLTGRLASSYLWSQDSLADGGHTLGMVGGWAGLTGGTRDVKSELRLGYASEPTPDLTLQRAWTKFRVPGVRFTTGLGRLAWGPGLVYVPGDLLFDSTGTDVDWGGDELRSSGAWLADSWVSLGDEAFVEAAVVDHRLGARISAAPWGTTLEAAGAWDTTSGLARAAVSTQFHLVVDWYGTLRWDTGGVNRWTGSLGAFGLWTLFETVTVSTRHEVLGFFPEKGEGSTYHDLSLAFEGSWSTTARVVQARPGSWSPSAEVRWGPLQNLSLAVSAGLEPAVVQAGVTARW